MYFVSDFIRNRGLQCAIAGSILWHVFWLFAVAIDISPQALRVRHEMSIYFLGPSLSDEAFGMIIESKPRMGQTAYHGAEDIAKTLEPETGTLERERPADLTGVSLGQTTWNSIRGILKQERYHPDMFFNEKFAIELVGAPFPVSGQLKGRGIFFVPDPPSAVRLDMGRIEQSALSEAVFALTVNASGAVTRVKKIISSGDPEADIRWERYLRQWQFMPLPGSDADKVETGEVRLRPAKEEVSDP